MVKLHNLDLAAERVGVEVAYDEQPGIVLKLARMNNPAMIAWKNGPAGQDRLRELKTKLAPADVGERWAREAMAECVLLGWSGIDGDDGQPLPYSAETALELLTDPRKYPFFLFVLNAASDMNRYLEADKADAAKNSGTA